MYHAENRHGVEMVEIKSSLWLQIAMYYQAMFSFLYFVVTGGCLLNKLYNYEISYVIQLLACPIFLLWSFTEVVRVGLGYVGNLTERVPMISAFLLLTIFPQFVAVMFFTFLSVPIFPFDTAAGGIMIIMLLVELVIGRITLNLLIKRQTAQFFRLCQEEAALSVRPASSLAEGRARPLATAASAAAVLLSSSRTLDRDQPRARNRLSSSLRDLPTVDAAEEDEPGEAPAPAVAAPSRAQLRRRTTTSRGDVDLDPQEARGLLDSPNDAHNPMLDRALDGPRSRDEGDANS
ncbi:hypothetical protein M885DRAFT_618524 [Pelagophyceae sp. CCMP2097]|nr:hypothetical protein M885DRAFT_618524 [Pelagophyceae sp. CCMP2097]